VVKNLYQLLPSDYTPEEVAIVKQVVVNLYQKLDDPIDKFIVAFHYDLGYPTTMTSRALMMSDVSLFKRIKKIKTLLSIRYHEEKLLKRGKI
jgi:hypothetical protein